MLTEIACGPISESAVVDEIPFICALFLDGDPAGVSVEYGWACDADIDAFWQPTKIATNQVSDWINRSVQHGIYKPGRSDIFIEDRGDH